LSIVSLPLTCHREPDAHSRLVKSRAGDDAGPASVCGADIDEQCPQRLG
jgi:hypothetical protein